MKTSESISFSRWKYWKTTNAQRKERKTKEKVKRKHHAALLP
jgi:hypothetical protein